MYDYYGTQPDRALTIAYLHGFIDGRMHWRKQSMYRLHGLVEACEGDTRAVYQRIRNESTDNPMRCPDSRQMGMNWVNNYWGSRSEMQAYLHGYLFGYEGEAAATAVSGVWAISTREEAEKVIHCFRHRDMLL